MKNITGAELEDKRIDPINMRNPSEGDIFTNRFREDMKIKATKREIIFKMAKRMPDYAKAVKGIEAKKNWLVADHYAQDDDYLAEQYLRICGDRVYYDRKNDKRDKLQEIIEELEKQESVQKPALMVFCEHEVVAKSIYDFIKGSMGRIVAMKTGKTELIEGERTGNLVSTLHQYIRRGDNTVVLIVTGKSGGTGLNMGDFDAIVHYEIPYTSIALEQRFGRIDRMAGGRKRNGTKKMYFILDILDKVEEGDSKILNRLFWFCVTKLDITCQYLPVRNTVLFYPEMVNEYREKLKSELAGMTLFGKGNFDDKYQEIVMKYKDTYGQVKKIWEEWKLENPEKKEEVLENWEYYQEPPESLKDEVKSVISTLKKIKPEYVEYKKAIKGLREFIARTQIVNLLCNQSVEAGTDIFVHNYVETEKDFDGEAMERDSSEADTEEALGEILYKELHAEEKEENTPEYQKQYNVIREKVEAIDPSIFEGPLANGIFFYSNGSLTVQDVDEFREGN